MSIERTGNPELQAIVNQIKETTNNPTIDIYADGTGPLTIDMVDKKVVFTSTFEDICSLYGWPNRMDDEDISPIEDYGDASGFIAKLIEQDNTQGLDNLTKFLSRDPVHKYDGTDTLCGIDPVVHRAQLVAPALFNSIRELYRYTQNLPDTSGQDILSGALRDPVASEQIYKAFKILGRLIKASDSQIIAKKISPNMHEEVKPIASAQSYWFD